MNSVEIVKNICRERKIPISRLEKDLGFSNGYINSLKNGVFPTDRLIKIADYLNLQAEYLMTGECKKEEDTLEIKDVYLSYAREAQKNGISPEDIKLAIETIKKLRGE